jgi:hypothetical protein
MRGSPWRYRYYGAVPFYGGSSYKDWASYGAILFERALSSADKDSNLAWHITCQSILKPPELCAVCCDLSDIRSGSC